MKQEHPPSHPAFFRRRDILIAAAILLAAAVWLAVSLLRTPAGTGGVATATIAHADGSSTSQEISLSQNGMVEIDAALPVHLEVKDGAVRFVNSECPDHVCEGFGWLRHEGDTAICVPAGVSVRVTRAVNNE